MSVKRLLLLVALVFAVLLAATAFVVALRIAQSV